MTNTQLKVLKELLTDPTFKGKRQLGHLIWANTHEPKFNLGDCYYVSDLSRKIFGVTVKDFCGRIVEIIPNLLSEEFEYRFECQAQNDDCEVYTFFVRYSESKLNSAKPCEGYLTYLV